MALMPSVVALPATYLRSYSVQKFIGGQLVADYTRKGFVRGRPVRLMTVAVRPGKPNAAASSFVSGIICEPLAGQRATCPVPPDTPVASTSGLRLRLRGCPRRMWGPDSRRLSGRGSSFGLWRNRSSTARPHTGTPIGVREIRNPVDHWMRGYGNHGIGTRGEPVRVRVVDTGRVPRGHQTVCWRCNRDGRRRCRCVGTACFVFRDLLAEHRVAVAALCGTQRAQR